MAIASCLVDTNILLRMTRRSLDSRAKAQSFTTRTRMLPSFGMQ